MIYRRFFNVPTWKFRSPVEELYRLRQQMEQMLESAATPQQREAAGVLPLINLTEGKDHYLCAGRITRGERR